MNIKFSDLMKITLIVVISLVLIFIIFSVSLILGYMTLAQGIIACLVAFVFMAALWFIALVTARR